MQTRKLGRTDLEVGEIGLGTEYLRSATRGTVLSVVHEALARGINYIDVIFAFQDYQENLAAALKGRRDQVILTGHLGSGEKDGQYHKTRRLKPCEKFLTDLLTRFDTEYVDVLMVSNLNSVQEYEKLLGGGVMDLALRLQREGKARYIGLSGHDVPMALQAVESGLIDVLMFPVNLVSHALPGRQELLNACVRHGVGVVAMKPFAGGKLFQRNRKVYIARYQTGGSSDRKKIPAAVTPVQCLSYVLTQAGVCTTVAGVRNADELVENLAFVDATPEERDFAPVLADFQEYVEGECVYCNHCLPCPVAIDVGQVNLLLDLSADEGSEALRAAYVALAVPASACTECGACVARCPFGVDVIARMHRVVELFE